MQMAGEDQLERRGRNPVDDPREMAEENTKRSSRLYELVRTRPLRPIGLRVDANDRDAASSNDPDLRLVSKQRRPLEVAELRCARERVAGDGDVVVAEYDERIVEELEERT